MRKKAIRTGENPLPIPLVTAMLRQLQASDRDPMLFLLQSLTDLETGHTAEEPVAPDADSQQPATQEPEQNSVAAPVVDQPKVQAEPETLQEAPGAESAFEENASLFDRAEAELQGEYEATALNPDELAQLADKASNAAPAEASAQKDSPAEPQEGEPRKSRSGLTAALLVLLVLLVLLTLWFGAGVLMMYSIIPKVDLGYSWFNQNLFNLFRF